MLSVDVIIEVELFIWYLFNILNNYSLVIDLNVNDTKNYYDIKNLSYYYFAI